MIVEWEGLGCGPSSTPQHPSTRDFTGVSTCSPVKWGQPLLPRSLTRKQRGSDTTVGMPVFCNVLYKSVTVLVFATKEMIPLYSVPSEILIKQEFRVRGSINAMYYLGDQQESDCGSPGLRGPRPLSLGEPPETLISSTCTLFCQRIIFKRLNS